MSCVGTRRAEQCFYSNKNKRAAAGEIYEWRRIKTCRRDSLSPSKIERVRVTEKLNKLMENQKLKKEDLELLIEELRKYFLAQLTLLKGVCQSELQGKVFESKIVIASSCSTGTAIYKIGGSPEYFYSEMMMLARSFIEKLTNFCYLQVCGDEEYEKFFLHPYYKAFHNSDRSKFTESNSINLKYTGKEKLKENKKIKRALEVFSETDYTKNWSNLNIDKKVAFIAKNTKIKTEFFLLNTLSIYSNASEALHGSLYGCALATGAYTPGVDAKKKDEVEVNLQKNTALIYVQLGSIINEVLNLISLNGNKTFSEGSRKNQEVALSIMKVIFKSKDSEEG